MMKVKILTAVDAGQRTFRESDIAYLDDADAQALINCGAAELVLPPGLRPVRISLIVDNAAAANLQAAVQAVADAARAHAVSTEMPAGWFDTVVEQPGIDRTPQASD